MKKFLSILFSLILFSTLVYSQTTVKVTIRANTSTVPDTLGPTSYVQLRGETDAFGAWSSAGPLLTNVDGDYWETTLNLPPGSTFQYKFFTNTTDVTGENEHKGWEQNSTDPSGNRILVVPNADVVLPVQFVNGTPSNQPQDFTPLVAGPDEVAVMFRVNMQGNTDFNKATQYVAVRGGFPASDGWSRNFVLTREQQHGNGGSQNYDGTNFWSGVTTIPKSEIGTEIQYKFVILNSNSPTADVAVWGKDPNRTFIVGGDTTLHWKWWDDGAPVAITGTDTVIVRYRTDLSTAIRSRGFTTGDTVQVRSGYNSAKHVQSGETPSVKYLTKTGLTGNIYTATDTLIGEIGGELYYQYYLIKNGQEVREIFYNFDYTGTETNLNERRSVTLTGRDNSIVDTISNTTTNGKRQPDFRNQQTLARNVTVKLVCDLRPAYYTLLAGGVLESSQSDYTLTKNDAERLYSELGVWVNGPMAGDWYTWGGTLRDSVAYKMYDDGTHGDDVAGDRKYTALIELGPNMAVFNKTKVGQEFKFGIYGEDNEGGYGNNHIENINDSQSTFTLNQQFGSIDPKRFFGWDFNAQAPIISPDEVKVTIRANTATVPDTLGAGSYVQLRGGADAFGNWSSAGPLLRNVDGDYWETTLSLKPGETIQYKFFTNTTDVNGNGWEQNSTDPSGNRILVVPNADVVLPLQFVNGTPSNQPQTYTPLVAGANEVAVMFRVNMQSNTDFNKETQYVAVRGGFPASGGDWSRNFVLTREQQHGNGGSQNYDGTNFWSGVTTIPKSEVGTEIQYKFVILNSNSPTADVAVWGKDPNRTFIVGGDTTLHWKWWDDGAPVAITGTDTVIVNYRTDLSTAIRSRGFTTGDTIQVRSGHNSAKHFQSGETPSVKYLTKTGITGNIYTATDTLIGEIGGELYYQYYLIKNGQEVREIFYNFSYTGTEPNLRERRAVTLTGRNNNIVDTISNTTTNVRRQPDFRNQQTLARNVTVKLICDLRPAYYTLLAGGVLESSQSDYTLTKNDAERLYSELGVWVNGPMAGDWYTWGGTLRDSVAYKMYDDGTHGDDVAGDRKYTALIELGPNMAIANKTKVGQEFKFGIYGEDNEGGYGNNHIENINDGEATFTLNQQFGSIEPSRYFAWDFDAQQPITTGVDKPEVVPLTYSLMQNYPNPFNPSTIISYDIPKSSNVSLRVYDIMGREVATLVNEVQATGRYEIVFAAKNLSSGVYFYRLTAGDFTAIKKMVLMK